MNTQLKNIAATLALSLFSLTFAFSQTPEEGFGYLNSERPEKAKEVFTKLAESSPSADNYYNLGYYYVRTNQLDEAQKAFEKGLAVDDKSYLNQVGLATVALGKGDVAKAKEMIEYAEKKTRGKDANVLFRAGEAYTLFDKNSDPAEAIRLLDEAVKRDNKLADAYIVKGDVLSKRNEGGPAVTAYEYALMAKPNYALANNRIGQIYLRGKNYNQALDFYKKAIEADPEFAPAYKDLAELYFLAQQYKRAAENFDLYIQKSGNNDPETVLRAAQFAFTADEYARSLELLESIKGKIDNPITKRMYGWAYYKTNNMEESIKNLEEFIKVYPQGKDEDGNPRKLVPDDYKYLGRAYNKMATDKEYTPQGMEYLMKGAEMDTSAAEAATTYKEIAAAYYKDKDYLKAAKAYEKGIGLDTAKASTNDYFQQGLAYFQGAQLITVPDSAGVPLDSAAKAKMPAEYASLDSAGLAMTKKGIYLQADSTFAKGIAKLPDWPYNYYWRGSSLYNAYDRQENIDKGISAPYYEKFAELAEKDPSGNYKAYLKQVYSYLAYYYQTSVKDEAKAKSYWQKLLVVDPENKTAKDALGMSEPAAITPKTGK
ncbi:tetratricopeptide repeat protein [Salmonirosea aquatica]|uniref:Tetratricopeptide repeat protein n=1 Tax=Salmonirosea aquatica TaxID=2654236 RepID=A0A7C9FD83_9BACT|nr:tetratricopeptide repeat protein [Cytophagaceae bacterium SJW1-29]